VYYGCDSYSDAVCDSQELYFYLGEIGGGTVSGSATQGGYGPFNAFNTSASGTVNVTSRGGTYGYWFLLGPTCDPSYDGTSSEAYSWGGDPGVCCPPRLGQQPQRKQHPIIR